MLDLVIKDLLFNNTYPISKPNLQAGDRVSFPKETIDLIKEYKGDDSSIKDLKEVVLSNKPYFSVLFVGSESSIVEENIVVIETAFNKDMEVRSDILVKI